MKCKNLFILLILIGEVVISASPQTSPWYYRMLGGYLRRAGESAQKLKEEARESVTALTSVAKGTVNIISDIKSGIVETMQSIYTFILKEYQRITNILKVMLILQQDFSETSAFHDYLASMSKLNEYFQIQDIPIMHKLIAGHKAFSEGITLIKSQKTPLKAVYLIHELALFIQNINYVISALSPFIKEKTLVSSLQSNISIFFDRISRFTELLVDKSALEHVKILIESDTIPRHDTPSKASPSLQQASSQPSMSFFQTVKATYRLKYGDISQIIYSFFKDFNKHFTDINKIFDDIEETLSILFEIDQDTSGKKISMVELIKQTLKRKNIYESVMLLAEHIATINHILITTIPLAGLSIYVVSHLLSTFETFLVNVNNNIIQHIKPDLVDSINDITQKIKSINPILIKTIQDIIGNEEFQKIYLKYFEYPIPKEFETFKLLEEKELDNPDLAATTP